MNKHKDRRGFTMAEMLIVVAIIVVLAGVAFVAVAQHQRSLERLERDSVAREIFVAAQNHLTMAEGQGFLGLADQCGEVENAEAGIYYFVVNGGDKLSEPPASLLDLMLPFGAIDETVRGGGNYIIRYQKSTERTVIPATVMDVFYCSSESTDKRFGHTLTAGEESALVDNWREGKTSSRQNYKGKVLGWYGGAQAEGLPSAEIYPPLLVVENGDKLRIGVKAGTGPNGEFNPSTSKLKVTVVGNTSGAMISFDLSTTDDPRIIPGPGEVGGVACDYAVILDDITTAGLHFADLVAENGTFQPGEDIVVQAIAFDNTAISNIAYSAEKTTNSLFDKVETGAADDGDGIMTATVSSIRHLENLDRRVSNVDDLSVTTDTGTTTCQLRAAVQANDLDWNSFKANTGGDPTVIHQFAAPAEEPVTTDAGCYQPVKPTYALSYDGQGHSISNIKVDHAGEAGLFEAITGTGSDDDMTTIRDLALVDFDITQKGSSAGNAGTLAGTLSGVKVSNVVSYDQKASSSVTANSGNAGGLIGSATGCVIEKSAASVKVTSAAGDAGGLAGTTNGGSITACYAGGHTTDGAYDPAQYDVTATAGNAGGLIGLDVSTNVSNSYSTCSATGETAGGFVASGTASFSNCYATGLVKGTGSDTVDEKTVPKDGAFAYTLSGTVSGCHYLEIINEREDEAVGYKCLTALGKEGTNANITPVDADLAVDAGLSVYDGFVGDPNSDWAPASPCDDALLKYYDGKYPLQTVEQLGATLKTGDDDTTDYFVTIHRGDWPAPEIFVLNTEDNGDDGT